MFEQRNLKLDLCALALLALVLFLALALATYNKADPPSTLVYPPGYEVHNLCGHLGAWAAHRLLELVGVGAWYLVVSLGVLDALLLTRRPIDQPLLRTFGWLLSLVGVVTLAALVLSGISPGPVIGPGGYLGAAGRGLLEVHFATAGSVILVFSVILSGLLLSTDYYVFRMSAGAIGVSGRGLVKVNQALQREAAKAAAGKKSSKSEAVEEDGDAEADEAADAVAPIRIRVPSDDDAADEAAPADAAAEAAKPAEAAAAAKPSMTSRMASALRIRKPKHAIDEAAQSEREEVMEKLDAATQEDEPVNYNLPPIDMLLPGEEAPFEQHEAEVRHKAKLLEKTFASFGFKVKVVEIETGPVIAQYEIELEAGLRLSKITSLADDLAIALRVPSVRIVAPIPGKNTVGIEVPNEHRQIVRLRDVMEGVSTRIKRMKIPIFLGKDVSGKPMAVDLASLPHLLIAGRTGTGKSVCLNSIIVSMLMSRGPDEVRMLMIDPKMVELSPYKTLPHLMHPVVTDMRKAEAILAWAVEKMEERYALLARAGVRHLTVYNQLGEEELRDRLQPEDEEQWKNIPKHMPFIVIVADEIADLMMTNGKDVEQHIIRLAQKSRAVGIHLILATQKPTVDVITGLIKSNLPARIAFQVSSRTDSRVVLDEMGADKLLGNGDMLFLQPGTSQLLRGQGTYLTDEEINSVIEFVGTSEPQFVNELVQLKAKDDDGDLQGKLKSRDDLYESAVDVVVREGRGSVSLLQRALGIGYGRAARLIDYMAEDGIVGEYNGSQAREVTLSVEDWEAMNGEASSEEAAKPAKPAKSPAKSSPKGPLRPTAIDDADADEEPAPWEEDEPIDFEEAADEEDADEEVEEEISDETEEDEDVEEEEEETDEESDEDDAEEEVAEDDEEEEDDEPDPRTTRRAKSA